MEILANCEGHPTAWPHWVRCGPTTDLPQGKEGKHVRPRSEFKWSLESGRGHYQLSQGIGRHREGTSPLSVSCAW